MARTYIKGALPSFTLSAVETCFSVELTDDGTIVVSQPGTENASSNLTAAEAVKFGDALSALGLRGLAMKRGDV